MFPLAVKPYELELFSTTSTVKRDEFVIPLTETTALELPLAIVKVPEAKYLPKLSVVRKATVPDGL